MPCAAESGVPRGFILVASLLILLVLALLAATVMETGLLQLRMTTQAERQARARHSALGQLERWLQYLGHSVPVGGPGERHCTEALTCDYPDLPGALAPEGSNSMLQVVTAARPPPRLAEFEASSAVAYRATGYEITVEASAEGSSVSITQGVTVLHPGGSP